jgi:thiosulfate dehydrogenase [quinone] large subunit
MKQYSGTQLNLLVIVRVLIGWHFLYEGTVKLYNPNWTAVGYLNSAEGIFAGLFQEMAANPSLVTFIDNFNIIGQIVIGLGLILGFFTSINACLGILLLMMYYLAHPPFPGLSTPPGIGNYLIVDRNLIELFTLALLLAFPSGHIIGFDRWLTKKNTTKELVNS